MDEVICMTNQFYEYCCKIHALNNYELTKITIVDAETDKQLESINFKLTNDSKGLLSLFGDNVVTVPNFNIGLYVKMKISEPLFLECNIKIKDNEEYVTNLEPLLEGLNYFIKDLCKNTYYSSIIYRYTADEVKKARVCHLHYGVCIDDIFNKYNVSNFLSEINKVDAHKFYDYFVDLHRSNNYKFARNKIISNFSVHDDKEEFKSLFKCQGDLPSFAVNIYETNHYFTPFSGYFNEFKHLRLCVDLFIKFKQIKSELVNFEPMLKGLTVFLKKVCEDNFENLNLPIEEVYHDIVIFVNDGYHKPYYVRNTFPTQKSIQEFFTENRLFKLMVNRLEADVKGDING